MNIQGGSKLIGNRIEMWQDGKYGRFKSTGTIVDYYKSKNKKISGRYLIHFDRKRHFQNTFKMWVPYSGFTLIK